MNEGNGNLKGAERIASALFGIGLTLVAARRGGPLFRILMATAGTSLIGRAVAGHCAVKAAATGQSTFRQGIQDQWRRTSANGQQLAQSLWPGNTARLKHIEKTVEVDRPIRMVYDQWTQFEDFPRFMVGVQQVRQIDDTHVHWRAEVFGKVEEWDAEITEQQPDQRISWKSVSGPPNAGTVRFKSLGENRTRVRLVMAYAPVGRLEAVGAALGAVSAQVATTLRQFKTFIEMRSQETGAWRGEVRDSHAR